MESSTKQIIKNTFTIPNLLGSVIPLQIFGVWALYKLFEGSAPSWWVFATLVGYICIKVLGVTSCYHKMLSHKGFTTTKFMRRLMLWFALVSGQGSPIFWVLVHRGYHHRYTDKAGDPHSPKEGFWHSYILWMFKLQEGSMNSKYVIDLLRDEDCVFIHKHYIKLLWASHLVVALISVDLWLYTMLLPAFITFHSYSIQTSLGHNLKLGYANYKLDNDAVNLPWLFPFILGECWHNNHHGDPQNPNYGGRHWWELDPGYWLIKLIRTDHQSRS